jgi:hypothetical protein
MASNFIYGPMASTATARLPIGGLDWVPGGIQQTDPSVPLKRRALVTGVPPYTTANENGMRDNLPNGRVHITKGIDLSGSVFTSEHLGIGELLFESSWSRSMSFGTQQTRIVTYSDVNRRLGAQINEFTSDPNHAEATCMQLYAFAMKCARQWKFIGAQPTDHAPMSVGRDFVHMAVAASHKCNVANVFLADNVPSAGDRLYLHVRRPAHFGIMNPIATRIDAPEATAFVDSLVDACLFPHVSKHRCAPPGNFNIYIGIASFMYGTQYDPRDPYRIQALAMEAIKNTTRQAQLRAIKAMPTVDVFLLR